MLLTYSFAMVLLIIIPQDNIKQGITGNIYIRQGNYMPSPGKKAGQGEPVSTEVLVYELTTRELVKGDGTYFSQIPTKLIAQGKSDSKGHYAIALTPGLYTVFVVDKGKLYANSFDGKGNINPIIVKKDSLSYRDIVISSGAVY